MAIVLLMILEHLRRVLHGAGPYEISMWVMEFLVLWLIAYEVVHGILSRRGTKKREREIKERLDQVFVCIAKGQVLLVNVPPLRSAEKDENKLRTEALEWCKAVTAWNAETIDMLEAFPAFAVAAFADNSAITSAVYPDIPSWAQRHYSILNHKLFNLRVVIEKPDRYL